MQGRSSSLTNAISLLGAFVATAMVLGVLAAGMFVPVASIIGSTVQTTVASFDALPAQLQLQAPMQQTKVYDRTGKILIASLSAEDRQHVTLKAVAPIMRKAQLAIEDDRYYEHGGIDAQGIARAFVSTLQGQQQGASTITQQYVRQTLVQTAVARGDTKAALAAQTQRGVAGYVRKLQEAKYAIALEKKMSKDQILENYFNLVFYGHGAYGIESAARRFFGIPASKLNLGQSATLAGLVQTPSKTDPILHPAAAKARRNAVLDRMADPRVKIITAAVAKAEKKKPLVLRPTTPKMNCTASAYPYLCTYAETYLLDLPALGKTEAARYNLLYKTGVTVRTTFDISLIRKMDDIFSRARGYTRRAAAGAVVQPGTGYVLGIGQSRPWKKTDDAGTSTQINLAVDKKYGGSTYGFQIGSTGKLFTLIAALESGWTSSSSIRAVQDGTYFYSGDFNGDACGWSSGPWHPSNAADSGKEVGTYTLQVATAKSVNTAFANLASKVGACPILSVMDRMGMHTAEGTPYGRVGAAGLVLGSDGSDPVTLAASYATLAAKGKFCEATPVMSVARWDGTKVAIPGTKERCRVAIDSSVAYETTKILETVLHGGGTASNLGIGRPVAGKTGTSDNSRQTTFAGYTPQLSTAVWYGTDPPSPMWGLYGATGAGPYWERIMRAASADLPEEDFHEGNLRRSDTAGDDTADTVEIPDVTGRGRFTATSRLEDLGFSVKVSADREPSEDYSYGRVVRTEPPAGARAQEGDTITLILSSGSPARRSSTASPRSSR